MDTLEDILREEQNDPALSDSFVVRLYWQKLLDGLVSFNDFLGELNGH